MSEKCTESPLTGGRVKRRQGEVVRTTQGKRLSLAEEMVAGQSD